MLTTLVMHPFQISQILQRLDRAVYGRLTDSLRCEGRRGLNDSISRGIALEKPPDLFTLPGEVAGRSCGTVAGVLLCIPSHFRSYLTTFINKDSLIQA